MEKAIKFIRQYYIPPFVYDKDIGYILDSGGFPILQLKGWKYIRGVVAPTVSDEAVGRIHDKIGQAIVDILNDLNVTY